MTTPCIICVAITGSVPTKANNPAVPITVEEQIESTQEAFEAGADGVIASPHEATQIRSLPNAVNRLIVTPGVSQRQASTVSPGSSTAKPSTSKAAATLATLAGA